MDSNNSKIEIKPRNNSYKPSSEKAIDAPLSRKMLGVRLEVPTVEALEKLPTYERLTLVRRAIARELGLLKINNS